MPERLFLRLPGDPLYAPETGAPRGTMREHAVAAPLREFIAVIASCRETLAGEVQERVLPDGALRLVFNFGDAPRVDGQAGLMAQAVGPSAAPVVLRLNGRLEGLSVTLRAGAAAVLLGVPAGELADRALPLQELWRDEAEALVEHMAAAEDDAARVALLQSALQRRLHEHDADARRQAARAATLISEGGGSLALREVAAAVGIGERRLQQLFQAHVGLPPRAWKRLARLHACLRALRQRPQPRWPELALDAGFYDQSHLVNEFRALCGLAPGLFLQRAVAGSSKTTH